jgi:hypothetical protein
MPPLRTMMGFMPQMLAAVALVIATAAESASAAPAPVRIAPGPAAAAEIQAAIDRIAKVGGGTVEIGPGRVPLRAAIRLADGVTLVGTPGQTVLAIEPGVRRLLAAPVAIGDTEVRVEDATGLEPGDDAALEDAAGHGFRVTTATIVERTGSNTPRLSRPAESDYLPERGATIRRAHAGVGGWGVKNAAVEGVVVECTLGQPGSQQLDGCRGGWIYLFDSADVAVAAATGERFHRLHEGLTVYVHVPDGREFTVGLDVRDLTLQANGPREILFKVYDPAGKPVVREVIPDDGCTTANLPDRIGGWDHELQSFVNHFVKGTTPSIRWSAWSDPARLATIRPRRFDRGDQLLDRDRVARLDARGCVGVESRVLRRVGRVRVLPRRVRRGRHRRRARHEPLHPAAHPRRDHGLRRGLRVRGPDRLAAPAAHRTALIGGGLNLTGKIMDRR